jgi:hypothetical protein
MQIAPEKFQTRIRYAMGRLVKVAGYRVKALPWLAADAEGWLAGALLEAVLGPRPSLMMARESGTILVCQPLSACNFSIAAWVCASQWPLGSPER